MENNKQSWNKSKVLYVVLSILFSCAIWLYVDSINNPEKEKTISDIPIEYIGADTILADRGLMVLPESDQTMTLTIKARRLILAKLDPDKIRIQANLSDITETGPHNVGYTVRYPSNIPRDAVSYSNASYAAHVEIGELYRRNVDIRCTLTGTVAEGYIAGELRLEPETLELRGPRSEVDAVAYAKVTLAVDNATETVTKSLDYQLFNASGERIEDTSDLRATTDQIQVTLPVNVEKELPLRVNFIEADGARIQNLDYSITPASITVSGAAELLKDVEYITLDDFDLAEFVGPSTYRYTIPVPAGCENLSGSARATMTVRFRDMASAKFTAVKFSCENVPEGKTVTVLTTELPVSLRGTAADVASVTAEDITVTADLTDFLATGGSYTVPAKVSVGSGVDVGVVGEYQVRINISEEADPEDTDSDNTDSNDTGQVQIPDPTVP